MTDMTDGSDTSDRHTVTLAGGVTMPAVQFGCAFGDWVGATEFQGFLPEQAWRALSLALDAGYRAFDGARVYGTERILGTLLGQRFAAGTIERDDVFVTTKLAHPATPPHLNISHLRTWNADEVPDIARRVRDDMAGALTMKMVAPAGGAASDSTATRKIARTIEWSIGVTGSFLRGGA